jgi:dienelactone hydrolase
VKPVPATTTNQNGEAVDYYTVPPANLVRNKKYPVVLDLYPVNRYDQNVQILANAGIYYSTATRLGLIDWQQVAEPADILAVYHELLKNPNIDTTRIYIYGRSFSSVAVKAMVEDHPDLWCGIILFSPVSVPKIPARHPSFFIAVGDQDDDLLQEQCKHLWQDACNQLVPARIHFEHAGHGFSTENYKTSYAKLTEFIQTGY